MTNRIYGEKVNIDSKSTESFYDQRAKTINNREQKYTTVLLGDQNPNYSIKWDKFEKDYIIPKLTLGKEKKVLDLGCGIGRWADDISDKCGYYCGVDFSAEMIKVAKQKKRSGNCEFLNLSLKEAVKDNRVISIKYDVIIVTGVSMYINDDELLDCYKGIGKLLNKDTILYLEESVGKNERLTLNNIWSENLKDYYGAIYRTREEYMEMLSDSIDNLVFVEEGYMNCLDKKEQSETSHWYTLIKREA